MAAGISSGVEVGGRWRLGGQLGQGAFGRVFRADDTSTLGLGAAAVKVMHPSTSPKEREAFHEEIRKVVSLRHPNLVAYLDSGEHRDDDGQPHLYLVTELCRYSLQAYLAREPGRLTADQCERLLADMAASLGYIHSRGLLHRDLKPANVLLGGDDWKLGDFGLTRAMSATGHYHHGTVVMGTPRYMSPELFEDGAASAASDVYAVGVTLHQALTGRTVHEGSDLALLVQVTTQPPKIDRDLPPHWRRLIEQCLDREPANRPGASQLPAVLAESRLKPSTRLAQLSGTSPLAKHLGSPLPAPPASFPGQSLHPSGQSAPAVASAPVPAAGSGGQPTLDDAGVSFGVPSGVWSDPSMAGATAAPPAPVPAAGPADQPAPATIPVAPTPGHPASGPTAAGPPSLDPVGSAPRAGRRSPLLFVGVLAVVSLLAVGGAVAALARRGSGNPTDDTITQPTGSVAPAPLAGQPNTTTVDPAAAAEAALRVAAVATGPSDAPSGFNAEDVTREAASDLCPGVNRDEILKSSLAFRTFNYAKAGQLVVARVNVFSSAAEAEAAMAAVLVNANTCDGQPVGSGATGETWTMLPESDLTIEGAVQTSATVMQILGGPPASPRRVEGVLAIYARVDDVLIYAAATDRATAVWYAQLMVARANEEVPPPKVEPVGDVGTAVPGPGSEVRLAAADPASDVGANVTEWLTGHGNRDLATVAEGGCAALGPVTAASGVPAAFEQAWNDLSINVRSPLTAEDHAQMMALAAPRYCPDQATRLGVGQP